VKVMHVRIVFMGLTLAVLLGYGLCRMWRSRTQAPARRQINMVFATHDLLMGMVIADEDIRVGSRPDCPSGCILSKAQVIGRRVVMPLLKGTMVCSSDVVPIEEASFTAPTMRALWVPISRVAGGSSLKSGDRVNVFASGAPQSAAAEHSAAMLKDVWVLAVEEERNSQSEGKGLISRVALMVSADDAHKLTRAGGPARIQLSVRKAAETK
jgi:Flp pilus assembly protein CpaB